MGAPSGVAVNILGEIYVADVGYNRVEALTPSGPPCVYTVGPASFQVPAAGGNLNFSIQAGGSCPWVISDLTSWLSVTGGSSGTGPANVVIVVSPNLGTALSSTILIAGVSVTITQATAIPLPTITAVVNAASFQNGPISPGEIVTLRRPGLGPSAPAGLTLDQTGKVSTSISGVQVLFSGTAAPLTYVSATQINAVD